MASILVNIENRRKYKIRTPSGVFVGGEGKDAGEILYKPNTNGAGRYYYYRLNAAGTAIEEVPLMTQDDIIASIAAIAKQERLRFIFYPVAGKDNWFWCLHEAAPMPIGYQCKVISWKVWTINTQDLAGGSNSVVDYMGAASSPVVAANNANVASIVSKSVGYVNPANGSIGLFFKGTTNPKSIRLMVNGSLRDSIDMEAEGGVLDGGNGTPLNKLYAGEVLIQFDNSVIPLNEE